MYYLNKFIEHYSSFVIIYFILLNSGYAFLLFLSVPQVFMRAKEIEIEEDQYFENDKPYPPVSIVVPAHNEEKVVIDSVNHILELNYPLYEIIIVNDGSDDKSLEALIFSFELYIVPPAFQIKLKTKTVINIYRSKRYDNLIVVDKEKGGKADALNTGINISKYAYFLALDADTLISKDALYRTMSPMIIEKDVMAVGGTIGVINDCVFEDGRVTKVQFPKTFLPGVQVVEYIRAYLFGRIGWNPLGGNMVISGAFGLFNKNLVIENGGYITDTVGEDMELTLKIHHNQMKIGKPYKILSIPDTVAWTEVPSSLKVLATQRERWHRGLIDCLWRHKQMFMNPRYGVLGLFAYPFFVFGELLAPVIEITGWVTFSLGAYLGIINYNYFLQFGMASVGLSLLLTFAAIILAQVTLGRYHNNTDFFKIFVHTVLENVGYRQLTVIWRLKGIYNYFRGSKSWGTMKRTGRTKTIPEKVNLKILD